MDKKILRSLMVVSGLGMAMIAPAMAHPAPGGDLFDVVDKTPPPPPPPAADEMPGLLGDKDKAPQPMSMCHHKAAPSLWGVFSRVDLTDSQKQKIRELAQNMREQIHSQRDAIKQVRKQIMDSLASGSKVTQDSLQPLLSKEENIRKTIRDMRIKTMLDIRNLLTSEQLKKIGDFYNNKEKAPATK